MKNSEDSFDKVKHLTESEHRTRRIISIIAGFALIVILIFIIDFAYVVLFKSKPIIMVGKDQDKYSSVFYDVYVCGDEHIIKFKTQKYTCKIEDNQETNNTNSGNIDDNNQTDSNAGNSQDNNNTSNDDSNTSNKPDNNLNNAGEDGNNGDDNVLNNTNDNDNKPDNSNNQNNISNKIDENNSVLTEGQGNIKIIDKSSGSCAQALDYYYEDANYKYYFTCIKSNSIYVIKNNNEYTIREALNNNIVTMDELIMAGFKPLKQSKNLVDR